MNLGTQRKNLKPGMKVKVVQKKDYASGVLTEGVIERILTSKSVHQRGIKVMLKSGIVGRVQEIPGEAHHPPSGGVREIENKIEYDGYLDDPNALV